MKDRVFKSSPENINCLDDLRDLVCNGCTVRLTLKNSKFWACKNLQSKSRKCGSTITCLQIFVLDNPIWDTKQQYSNNKIPTKMGLAIENQIVTKNNHNIEDYSDGNYSDSEDESNNVKKYKCSNF